MVRILLLFFIVVIVFSAGKWFTLELSEGPGEANLLVVEGWLPDSYLLDVKAEYDAGRYGMILTAGLEYDRYFRMYENGSLVFRTDNIKNISEQMQLHVIAAGSYNGRLKSVFEVWLNDSLIAERRVGKRVESFVFQIQAGSPIDSIAVRFTNDTVFGTRDRNLFVKDVLLDRQPLSGIAKEIHIDRRAWDGKQLIRTFDSSFAENASRLLREMGVASGCIMSVSTDYTEKHRTLRSAATASEWIKGRDSIRNINIVTFRRHARRTLYTYRKLLGDEYDVKVIPLRVRDNTEEGHEKVVRYLRELSGFVYYVNYAVPLEVRRSEKRSNHNTHMRKTET